jgi:hypothetical protein
MVCTAPGQERPAFRERAVHDCRSYVRRNRSRNFDVKTEYLGPGVLGKGSINLNEFARSDFAYAISRVEGKVIATDRLLFGQLGDLRGEPVPIKVTVEEGTATFLAEEFVFGVCIDLDGQSTVGDNYFDLFPGIPHSVRWSAPESPKVLFTFASRDPHQ